jgi:hypothetical protein
MWAAHLLQRYAPAGSTVLDMYGGNIAAATVYYTHRRYCYMHTYLVGTMTVVLAALFLDNKVLACEKCPLIVDLAMSRVLQHARQYTKRTNRPLGEMRGQLIKRNNEDEALEWTYPYILR